MTTKCPHCGRFATRRQRLTVCRCGRWTYEIVPGSERELAEVLSVAMRRHARPKEATR